MGSSIVRVGVPVYVDPPSSTSILLITPYCSKTAVASGLVAPSVNPITGSVVYKEPGLVTVTVFSEPLLVSIVQDAVPFTAGFVSSVTVAVPPVYPSPVLARVTVDNFSVDMRRFVSDNSP